REIEQILKALIDNKNDDSYLKQNHKKIESLLAELRHVAEKWEVSTIPYIPPVTDVKEQSANSLIYLTEDDELFAVNLVTQLEQDGFTVKYFATLQEFEVAFNEKIPAAIIMDIVFKEGDVAGAQIISRIKNNTDRCPPVIFTSVRDDLTARLEAARAGAQRYFCKPFDVKKLSYTLQGLISNEVKEAYRVLCIDDDESLLSYYETALQSAGITVKTLSNPLLALEVLAEFKPDVILIDVYMPECSGPEIAQVIRQDESWALVPIMFLSTETDLNIQLDALNLGGDDFMIKPVQAGHLISAVTAKAKRARRSIYLNKELSRALRESEFQLITSNQHNIVSSTDVAGRINFVNNKFCEISGYSQEELIGKNHRMLKSKQHDDAFYKELWDTISKGKVWSGLICNLNKDGAEYWVESTIVPFLDNKGKPYKYVSARTDITELREKEERLNRSQTFANIGTWDWNIKTGGLFWSERIWPLFGYTQSETDTTYENFMAAVHPEDRQSVSDAVSACVNERKEYSIEHRVVWPDGSIHWVHESGDVVRNESGEPLRMLGVVQDIDFRKRTEIIIGENEKQLVDAQALARIGNWKADLSSGHLSWSDEIYRIFGYEPGSIEPSVEVFHSMIHPLDRNKVFESEKRAEETGFHDVEHRIIRSDGEIRYVHELAHAENDKNGNLLYMAGTVQDITERVEAENKLRESEERFTFAVEGAGEGIWDWNLTTNVMDFSKVYMEMLGYAENELPSHVSTWINSVYPEDLPRAQKILHDYLDGQLPNYTVELRLRCKDGNYKWILCRGTVVERDGDGKAIRMIGVHS
ncbi:MAG: PAS domain-containing protein, partial [Gammaproteobacteria bacterium]|nr:PAS domain-containing protein [Gammaproteobacteria bacterium]